LKRQSSNGERQKRREKMSHGHSCRLPFEVNVMLNLFIIYLATLGMIFLDFFVFRRYKLSKVEFCWKKTTFELHLKRTFVG